MTVKSNVATNRLTRRIGRRRTKPETVQAVLDEHKRRKQLDIISRFGTVDYYEDYDYKQARKGRP
jgi:hypothetical protein